MLRPLPAWISVLSDAMYFNTLEYFGFFLTTWLLAPHARNSSPAGARLERFLADVAEVKNSARIPLVLVLYGLGEVQGTCVDSTRRREALVKAIEQRLGPHGLQLWDAHGYVANRVSHGEPLAELHGFDARIGHGHLNNAGHQAYSALLRELVTRLSDAQKGSGL